MTTVAIHVMAKESDSVVEAYLDFLERAGFSEIFLDFDGGASERVRARLRARPPGGAALRMRELGPDWWAAEIGEAARDLSLKQRHIYPEVLARTGCDWLLITDVDEYPGDPAEIRRILSEAPAEVDAVSLPPAEAVWGPDERDAPPFATRTFRVPVRRPRLWRLLRRLVYGDLHRLFENNMLSHKEGKQILRRGARFERINAHYAHRDGRRANLWIGRLDPAGRDLYTRHYDAISYERWIEKFRGRGATRLDHLRPRRRAQFEQARDLLARMEAAPDPEAARRMGERAFRRLYHLTWFQYLLLRLMGGVVRLEPARGAQARAAAPAPAAAGRAA
jgi:hypothetical protein